MRYVITITGHNDKGRKSRITSGIRSFLIYKGVILGFVLTAGSALKPRSPWGPMQLVVEAMDVVVTGHESPGALPTAWPPRDSSPRKGKRTGAQVL